MLRLCVSAVVCVVLVSCFSEPRMFRDELVPVPDVTEERVDNAQQTLESRGFLVLVIAEGTLEEQADCPAGTVVNQDPGPEEEVLQAATVTLEARDC